MIKEKSSFLFKAILSIILSLTLAFSFAWAMPAQTASAEQSTDEKLADAQARLDAVNAEMDQIESEITSVSSIVAQTTASINNVNEQITQKEAELADKQEALGERMASKYRSGTAGLIDLLLSSASFNEFTNNWFYANKVMEQDNVLINEVKAARQALDEEKANLEELKVTQEGQLQTLQGKQQEMVELVSNIDAEVQELMQKQNEERAAEAAAAAAQAAALAQAQQAAASNASSNSSYSGTTNSGSNSSNYSGTVDSGNTSSIGQTIVNACYSTPAVGYYLCATWVTRVYQNAGAPVVPYGNANDMFYSYCTSSDYSTLQPGMLIACGASGFSPIYGHVGIYVGNGMVMSDGNSGASSLITQSLSDYITYNGDITGVRWGFPW